MQITKIKIIIPMVLYSYKGKKYKATSFYNAVKIAEYLEERGEV